jgi:hypothetical protein
VLDTRGRSFNLATMDATLMDTAEAFAEAAAAFHPDGMRPSPREVIWAMAPDARTRWDTRSSNELLLLGAT